MTKLLDGLEQLLRDSRPAGSKLIDVGSQLVRVFEAPLRQGHFGQIDVSKWPYEILLNERVLGPRRAISLVHELLHAFSDLKKLHSVLPHDKLHDLAVFIFDEILPIVYQYTKTSMGPGAGHRMSEILQRPLPNVKVRQDEDDQSDRGTRTARRGDQPRHCDCQGRCDCAQ